VTDATPNRTAEWFPLTDEELAQLEIIRLTQENLALRQQILEMESRGMQARICARQGLGGGPLEVDVAGRRARVGRTAGT